MKRKLLVLALVIIVIVLYQLLDLGQYLNLEYLQARQSEFDGFYVNNRWLTVALYLGIYISLAAVSVPGAAILTLAGGAIFGLAWGVVWASFASSIGGLLAFLMSRFVLRDWVEARFRNQFKAINAGVKKEGSFYLMTVRIVPIFPFFLVNILMGLTNMKTWTYYWVSQLSMLPATVVYVNAGTRLTQINQVRDILSPEILISLALLGLFPLSTKKVMEFFRARKVTRRYRRPKRFDNNLVVIGAGSGGLVSAYIGATVNARVTLIEKHRMGGDCLNTGCVPSKSLIRAARAAYEIRHADRFGLKAADPEVDFPDVTARIREVITHIEPHDSEARYRDLGVNVIKGEAFIRSPWEVEVNGEIITTRNIIVATGARPTVPDLPGLNQVDYLTSENLWSLQEQPQKLVVLGGGPIGCELAQAFARLGSEVTQVELSSQLLGQEDSEVGKHVSQVLSREGVRVLTGHAATKILVENGENHLLCHYNDEDVRLPFDRILVAVGRTPNTTGFGLEELGVVLSDDGTIAVDPFLRTNVPNIFAVGDVAGPYQFTHTASHMAWYAAVNALFGGFRRFRVNYRVIPRATFTDPEVARVGLNEVEARERSIAYEITRYKLDDLDRAIAEGADEGWVKVLTVPGKDRILGATIVGTHASELITEFVTAMKQRIGLNKILGTIHIYPTLSEANKFAAGEWKKARKPEGLLRWVKRYHTWTRR